MWIVLLGSSRYWYVATGGCCCGFSVKGAGLGWCQRSLLVHADLLRLTNGRHGCNVWCLVLLITLLHIEPAAGMNQCMASRAQTWQASDPTGRCVALGRPAAACRHKCSSVCMRSSSMAAAPVAAAANDVCCLLLPLLLQGQRGRRRWSQAPQGGGCWVRCRAHPPCSARQKPRQQTRASKPHEAHAERCCSSCECMSLITVQLM